MKLLVNQALFSQGLQATQALGVFFDGIARHTPEGYRIPAARGRGRLQGSRSGARRALRRATIPRMKSRVAAERLRDLQSVTDAALAYLPLERAPERAARTRGRHPRRRHRGDPPARGRRQDARRAGRQGARGGGGARGAHPGRQGLRGARRRHRAAGPDRERREGGHLQPDPAREGPRVPARGPAAGGGRA